MYQKQVLLYKKQLLALCGKKRCLRRIDVCGEKMVLQKFSTHSTVYMQNSLSSFLAHRFNYIGIDTYKKQEEIVISFWRAIFLTTWPTVATVQPCCNNLVVTTCSRKCNQGELNCGAISPFSKNADATIGFSENFSIFYILGSSHEN